MNEGSDGSDVEEDDVDLRPPNYSEQVAIDSYKAGAHSALSDSSSFGDKVVTAAISIATAYGAVLALVAPKESPSTVDVVAPFIALAVAIGLALGAQAVSLNLDATNELSKIRSRVKTTINWKRGLGSAGLIALIVGLVWAGLVVHDTYGKPAEDETTAARLWLSDTGQQLLREACGNSPSALNGRVENADALAAKSVSIEVNKKACSSGAGTLVLPQKAIRISRLSD